MLFCSHPLFSRNFQNVFNEQSAKSGSAAAEHSPGHRESRANHRNAPEVDLLPQGMVCQKQTGEVASHTNARNSMLMGKIKFLTGANVQWAGIPPREAMLRAQQYMLNIYIPHYPAGTFAAHLQQNLDEFALLLDQEGEFVLYDVDRELHTATPPPTPPPSNDEEADEAGPSTKRPRTH